MGKKRERWVAACKQLVENKWMVALMQKNEEREGGLGRRYDK